MKEHKVWSQDGPCWGRILRWTWGPPSPPPYTPCMSLSLWVWVEPTNVIVCHSQDYATSQGKRDFTDVIKVTNQLAELTKRESTYVGPLNQHLEHLEVRRASRRHSPPLAWEAHVLGMTEASRSREGPRWPSIRKRDLSPTTTARKQIPPTTWTSSEETESRLTAWFLLWAENP